MTCWIPLAIRPFLENRSVAIFWPIKKTFLLINALEKASENEKAALISWIEKTDFDPKEKIAAVTELYQSIGVKIIAEEKVNDFFNSAIRILDDLNVQDVVKQPLRNLAYKMLTRKH